MPIDIGKKQTIEEITNGRIKKAESEPPRRRMTAEERPMTARRSGRAK